MVSDCYHADLQDFLRATGCLPKNRSPAALGKMRRIPVISWVAAGRWTETGETFLEEDVIEWIALMRGASRGIFDGKGNSSKRGSYHIEVSFCWKWENVKSKDLTLRCSL